MGYKELDKGQFDSIETVDYVTGAAFAIKRDIIKKLGYFDEDFFPGYYEETDICFRAKKLGYKVVYVPKAIIYHFEASTLKFQSQKYLRSYHRNRIKFLLKNFSISFILTRSLPFEFRWLIRDCPSSNYIPLLLAYLIAPVYFMKITLKKILGYK